MDPHIKRGNNMEEIVNMIESRMDQFDKTLAHTASKIPASTDTSQELSSLAAEFTAFKEMVRKILLLLSQEVKLLSAGLDDHDARSRNKILLFHGLKENKDEDVDKVIKTVLCDEMNLPDYELSSIDVCHRLGAKKDKPRPILVCFAGLKFKKCVWSAKTELKGTGITLSEFLTRPRQQTFIAARKHFGVKSCWTSDGVIIVQLPDKTRQKIVSSSELQQIIEKFPQPYCPSNQEPKSRSRRAIKTTK